MRVEVARPMVSLTPALCMTKPVSPPSCTSQPSRPISLAWSGPHSVTLACLGTAASHLPTYTPASSTSMPRSLRWLRPGRALQPCQLVCLNSGGKADEVGPEPLEVAHRGGEVGKARRLADEAVGVQPVRLVDVALLRRGGEHDDRQVRQVLVGADLAQGGKAVLAGHVDVEEDDVGAGRAPAAAEVGPGVVAAVDDVDGAGARGVQQRLLDEAAVALVIVDEQDGESLRLGLRASRHALRQ